MTLKVKVNDPHIQYKNLKMHIWRKIGDSNSNQLQVITQASQIS